MNRDLGLSVDFSRVGCCGDELRLFPDRNTTSRLGTNLESDNIVNLDNGHQSADVV